MLQSGKNSLIRCNYCDKQFWKLFSFFATIFIYTTLWWRGGCVGSVSARSLQTEPTAMLWVRVRSTDVYRVISLGKIFTPTRLG